jgi:hypothetical protein
VRHTSKNSDSMSSMDLLRTFDAAVLICIAVCNGNRAGSTHAELLQVAFDHRSSCLCLFDTNNKLQLPPALIAGAIIVFANARVVSCVCDNRTNKSGLRRAQGVRG